MSSLKEQTGKRFPPQTQKKPGLESKMTPRPPYRYWSWWSAVR